MSSINRRRFLTGAGLGVAALGAGFLGYRRYREVTPGDRLVVGFVGVAGQGAYNLNQVSQHAYVGALCDVDESRTGDAREVFPHAAFYTDFRRLVEHKGLDAVVIATPDHTHAPAAMAALHSGLHVYCEKPLGHTIQETRLLAEEAARQKRATQLGMQIHSGENYRRVVEFVQTGVIGTVEEVHVWTKVNWGLTETPRDQPPVPAGLHYDLWLGPAPERPYSPAYLPKEWRRWWDFGGGSLSDMGCHHMDLSFWALNLRVPTKVSAEGPPPNPEGAPSVVDRSLRIPGTRDPAASAAHLVRRRQAASPLRRGKAAYLGRRHAIRRQQGDADRRLQQSPTAAGEGLRGLRSAGADDCPVDRPPPRVGRGVQERPADDLQLQLRRRPDRSRSSGHRGLPLGTTDRLGRSKPARPR